MNQRILHNTEYTRLFILRHARTAFNVENRMQGDVDEQLDATGIQQAKKMTKRLSRFYPIEHVLSSPYPRAQETAAILAKAYDLTVEVNNDLIEVNFGDIDNQKFDDLEKMNNIYFEQVKKVYETDPDMDTNKPAYPGGESPVEIRARVKHFTRYVLDNYRGKCVAAISHGGFIKNMLAYYAGVPSNHPVFFSIENTSISVVDFLQKRAILRTVGDSGHLDKPIRYSRTFVM